MKPKFNPITLDGALYVAQRMRPEDRREIFALRWNQDNWDLAQDSVFAGKFGWQVELNEPIAIIGCVPLHPGVWNAFCYGTSRFQTISTSISSHVIRIICPALVKAGAHRLECWSIEGHDSAHRWLEMLGAKRECTRRAFGKGKEDFHCYAWSMESVKRLAKRHKIAGLQQVQTAEGPD